MGNDQLSAGASSGPFYLSANDPVGTRATDRRLPIAVRQKSRSQRDRLSQLKLDDTPPVPYAQRLKPFLVKVGASAATSVFRFTA